MDELKLSFMQLLTENSVETFENGKICEILRSHMRDGTVIKDAEKLYPEFEPKSRLATGRRWWLVAMAVAVLAVGGSVVIMPDLWDDMGTMVTSTDCLMYNNIFLMEMSRPIFDCNICRNVTQVPVVHGISREEFVAKYAYSEIPVLVKQATVNWTAMDTFTFQYFRRLYQDAGKRVRSNKERERQDELAAVEKYRKEHPDDEEYPEDGAGDEDEEDYVDDGADGDSESEDAGLACQFFPYKSDLQSLVEAMNMSDDRASFKEGEKSWYFGWSNCNDDVQKELRRHYSTPYFLPEGSETSSIDWLFMGGKGRGAPMHLDSVVRPSWQAQISGRKTWSLEPPPECLSECSSMDITLEQGDIFVVNTNVWYHGTFVHPGALSICIGSEYD